MNFTRRQLIIGRDWLISPDAQQVVTETLAVTRGGSFLIKTTIPRFPDLPLWMRRKASKIIAKIIRKLSLRQSNLRTSIFKSTSSNTSTSGILSSAATLLHVKHMVPRVSFHFNVNRASHRRRLGLGRGRVSETIVHNGLSTPLSPILLLVLLVPHFFRITTTPCDDGSRSVQRHFFS
ncbi:hypothetical protein HYFRA_00002306 [Hymenoscyphus fraxineus]|uniref:Uncharacterized protein n=1 Tax=Hymenoscyphus fraxineus TaxID=746836 RepID=A0A9N9PNF7_9HELO|nr:hypothetical protein HYFRA_00002306 [Hymenoscyphus fraxineus]